MMLPGGGFSTVLPSLLWMNIRWLILLFTTTRVIGGIPVNWLKGLQDLLELLDFLFNDLVSHTFSNSISVDDDLRGKVSLVLF